ELRSGESANTPALVASRGVAGRRHFDWQPQGTDVAWGRVSSHDPPASSPEGNCCAVAATSVPPWIALWRPFERAAARCWFCEVSPAAASRLYWITSCRVLLGFASRERPESSTRWSSHMRVCTRCVHRCWTCEN